MKRATIITIILTVLIGIFIVSCEDPVAERITLGSLTLSPTAEKELVWSADTEVTEYVYKATPLFSGSATGKTTDWQHLSFGGSGSAGELTQGKWHFELQGRNSKGSAITTGETDAYIEAGQDNVISVKMKTDPTLGTGSVTYNIWAQNVSQAGSVFKVYGKISGSSSFTLLKTQSDVSTENPRFNGTLTGLKAGYYELLFMLFDENGTVLGAEQLGVQIVTGEATTVSGIIEPSLEVDFELSIKSMGYVHAELFPSSGIEVRGSGRDKTAYIERGDAVTFTWKDLEDATSHPTEWIWALDGEVISNNTKSYTLTYDSYGEHELSVVGIRRDSSGVAWDCGSAVIRIIVVRHICEITFDANGGFFPDGTDISIIQEDTTAEDDRKIPGGQPYDGLSPQKTGYRLIGWADSTTGKKVVEIATDGTVTFLSGFITKEETRTLKAVWDAGTYSLKIVWGENTTARKTSVAYEETFSIKSGDSLSSYLDATPSRQGFVFLGYTTEENNRGDSVSPTGTFIWGKDTTIWANWEYVPITVSYYKSYSDYTKGITPYKTTIVGSDLRYGSLPQPLRQGKVFKGWAQPEDVNGTKIETDSSGNTYLWQDALLAGKEYVKVTTYVKKYYNHALVAVWGEGDIKITFDLGDATLTTAGQNSLNAFAKDSSGKYYKNGALGTMYGALPFTGIETTARAGMEFMGWYDSAAYNLRVYEVSSITTNNDHTLYAKWAGTKLMVSFSSGTGETINPIEVRYNNTYGTLPEVSRTGYEFVGWSYNDEIITKDSVVKVTTSHTLTAKWKEKQSTITLDTAGGTISGSTTYTVGYDQAYGTALSGSTSFKDTSTTSGLKEPTRVGYDFAGWYTNPAGSGTAIKAATVNKNDNSQTLYATWTAHRHTITFYNNWPTVSETSDKPATSKKSDIAFGTSYGDLPLLTVTGYTFNGWYTASSGGTRVSSTTKYDVDKDISLYARWSLTKVNISFYEDGIICRDENGLSLPVVERTWGSTLGTVTTPYKRGYDFTGRWQVVGKTDESGNPVYLTSSSVITYTEDFTLCPIWTPSAILILVPYTAEVSENGIISNINWTGAKTFQGTFKDSLQNLKTVVISGGKWTAGSSASLTTISFTKQGYWQNGWQMVTSGQSKEIVDTTALINDYGTMEASAIAKYGTVTPEKVLYLIPNWVADSYNLVFKNMLVTGSTVIETSEGPYKESVDINNGDTIGSKLGSDSSKWYGTWDGYACTGIYSDSGLTKEITASAIAGSDLIPTSGIITVYFKWQKLKVRYSVDTTLDTQYNNTRNELFAVNDIFNGISLNSGWYNFTGTVNEKTYTKIRKGTSSLTLISIKEKGTGSWVVPANMTLKIRGYWEISTASSSKYQITERCTVCNGAGYKSILSSNSYVVDITHGTSTGNTSSAPSTRGEGTTTQTANIHYRARTMYDFCPDGCINWTHENEHNSTKAHGEWVVCPNCNGNYSEQRQIGWSSKVVKNDYCDGHEEISRYTCPGHTHKVEQGSQGIEKEETYYCDGCVPEYETEYCSGCCDSTYVYWYDNRCYCEYQSEAVGGEYKPGYIWLAGYRLIGYENGGISIKKNSTEVSGSFTANEGDIITASLTPVTKTDTNLIVDLISRGYIKILDESSEFSSLSLAGSGTGSILKLDNDNYTPSGGRYLVANGNAVTTKPTTPYYSYSGLIMKNSYLDSGATDLRFSEEISSGFIASDSIDTSLGGTFKAVTKDGTVYTGTPTVISWNSSTIAVTYKDSSGNTGVFEWNYRNNSSQPVGNICSEFKLYCWTLD